MTRRGAALAAALLLAATGLAGPDPAPAVRASPKPAPQPSPKPPAGMREFCSLVTRCGIAQPTACTKEHTSGVGGVTYDEERCRDPRELRDAGLRTDTDLGFRVYRFLGRRYRTEYEVSGEVPISPARLGFLLGELPFAARLVSAFQDTRYEAEWLDARHHRFRAAKGDSLTGEAEPIAGSRAERMLYYYGRGRSKLGPWKMSGWSLVRFDWSPVPDDPRSISWRARVLATPENRVINMVMNMGVFRRLVLRHVREVVDDMTTAARALDATKGPVPGTWSAEDRAKIERLRAIP